MGDFFDGRIRKFGCVTLIMACLFTSLWVRSYLLDQYGYGDYLILGASWYECSTLHSRSGLLEFARPQGISNEASYYWRVPHAVIAVPLTLLSAWLILSKPRMPQERSFEQNASLGV